MRCKYCNNYLERIKLQATPHSPFKKTIDAVVCLYCDKIEKRRV
jgi:hypothetical protein